MDSRSQNIDSLVIMVDQALVSLCNFAMGILLARALGLEGYGQYALIYAVVQYLATFSGALIHAPMLTLAPQISDPLLLRRLLRGAFGIQLLLAVAASLLAVVVVVVLSVIDEFDFMASALLPMACVAVAYPCQDWMRRFHIARQRGVGALRADVIAYGGGVVLMALLAYEHLLSVNTALWSLALMMGLSFLVEMISQRLLANWTSMKAAYQAGRRDARSNLIGWQLMWVANQGILFIGAGLLGPEAVGAIRVTQNLMGPLNSLYQVLDNVLPVRAASEYVRSGVDGLLLQLKRTFWGGAALLAPLLVLIAVFAETLLVYLYGGGYGVHAKLVYWQCAFFFLQYVIRYFQIYHRTISHAEEVAWAAVLCMGTSLFAAGLLIPLMREIGILAAWCMAWALATLYLYVAARQSVSGKLPSTREST
jgi:O-antigen/teichoic acid export membrane protein